MIDHSFLDNEYKKNDEVTTILIVLNRPINSKILFNRLLKATTSIKLNGNRYDNEAI